MKMPQGAAGVDTVGVHEKGSSEERGIGEIGALMICRLFFSCFIQSEALPESSELETTRHESCDKINVISLPKISLCLFHA